MDERNALLALCAEPAALVERSGNVVATNERLQRVAGRAPATLGALLERLAARVARPDEFRTAIESAVRDGTTLRRYAATDDPEADDVEVLVLPELGGPTDVSLVVLRLPNRRLREDVLTRRHDRLALLGQMAAEAAHELNNVLTTMIGWSHLLGHPREGADPGELAERARQVETAALKAQRIVADLMGVARGGEERMAANVGAAAREVVRMMEGECARRAIELSADVPDDLEARIRRARLSQVLLNLVRNAVQALKHGGHIRISARAERGLAVIHVEDDGPGMDATTQARVFEPYFTTRRSGGTEEAGLGLGLPLSRRIIEQEAGGTIRLASEPGRGTTVEIRLPVSAVQELRSTGIRAAMVVPPAPENFQLLAVERDEGVAEVLRATLMQLWKVTPVIVSGLASACQALKARPFSVCLVDADADPDGPVAAVRRLAAARPDPRVVLTFSKDSWAGIGRREALPVASELHKPFSVPELMCALVAAAARREP